MITCILITIGYNNACSQVAERESPRINGAGKWRFAYRKLMGLNPNQVSIVNLLVFRYMDQIVDLMTCDREHLCHMSKVKTLSKGFFSDGNSSDQNGEQLIQAEWPL